jgi:hypothetical protein
MGNIDIYIVAWYGAMCEAMICIFAMFVCWQIWNIWYVLDIGIVKRLHKKCKIATMIRLYKKI